MACTTYPASRHEKGVKTIQEFITECARPDARIIRLDRSLTVTQGIGVPETKTVVMGRHKFYQGGGGSIVFYGHLIADRQQIFAGFSGGELYYTDGVLHYTPADIRGSFGGAPVYPEWWGLVDNHHDIAINCAISAGLYGGYGLIVSLAPGNYYVSAPLFLSGLAGGLHGAGMLRTNIFSTPMWTPPKWYATPEWARHAAMVYMGGTAGSMGTIASMGTSIRGLGINVYEAALANWDSHVSGISCADSFVEEGSIADDVGVYNASGCSCGFPSHDGHPMVVNGFKCTNFWFYGGMKRDTIPVYTSQWANRVQFSNGTIAPNIGKASSAEWNAPSRFPGDPPAYPTPPRQILDWALIGIQMSGNTTVNDIHMEGCAIGVMQKMGDVICQSSATNINGLWFSSPGQTVYFGDGRYPTGPAPVGNTNWLGYSTGILITGRYPTGAWPGYMNYHDSFQGSFRSAEGVHYLLRDEMFGKHVSAYGWGQFPATNTSKMSFYARGNGWTPTQNFYDYNNPSTDRAYFIGPIM